MPSMLYMLSNSGAIGKKKRELLSTRNFSIKYEAEILHFIEAAEKPEYIAVIHCHKHQKGISQIIQGNNWADWDAKKAVLTPITEMALFPPLAPSTFILRYSISRDLGTRPRGNKGYS